VISESEFKTYLKEAEGKTVEEKIKLAKEFGIVEPKERLYCPLFPGPDNKDYLVVDDIYNEALKKLRDAVEESYIKLRRE